MAKIALKYTKGEIPENLAELLANADEQDLRILISLMMAADAEGEVEDSAILKDLLGLELPEIEASVKFWRGAGVVTVAKGSAKKQKAQSEIKSAHREGAVEKNTGVSPYATEELAALFERRRVSAQFIDEAQRVLGKTFNSYDTGIAAGIVDGFDLGVGQSIFVPFPAVSAAAHDLVSPDDDTAHRHFTRICSRLCQFQCLVHIILVIHTLTAFGYRIAKE